MGHVGKRLVFGVNQQHSDDSCNLEEAHDPDNSPWPVKKVRYWKLTTRDDGSRPPHFPVSVIQNISFVSSPP